MKRNLLFISLFFFIVSIKAQQKTWEVGAKWINELNNSVYYSPGLGIQTIYKFTKHSGIESGLYFKVTPKVYLISEGPPVIYTRIRYNEKVIQLPLLYRFESRLINFTGGFAAEFLLNKKRIEKILPQNYQNEFFTRLEAIATMSVSKNWNLSRSWMIEPELRLSAPIPEGGVGTAINLSVRKKIH